MTPHTALDDLHREHCILSAHRCSCGWVGDSATTHIIDTLHLKRVGFVDTESHIFMWGDGPTTLLNNPEPLYRLST